MNPWCITEEMMCQGIIIHNPSDEKAITGILGREFRYAYLYIIPFCSIFLIIFGCLLCILCMKIKNYQKNELGETQTFKNSV
jgi:hypothetical protein